MSDVIRAVACSYGAVDVGITPLKPFHTYSHYGRRPGNWGEEIVVIVPEYEQTSTIWITL